MTKSTTKATAAPPSPSVASTSKPNLKKSSKVKRVSIKKEDDSLIASNKYLNVSINRCTGRWQAWTNCMATAFVSRGPYVGEHATENLAARAQDRSLLKHRALATKLPIKLNFPETDYASDEKLRNALTNEEFLILLSRESRACYKKVQATKCMQTFMAEEAALGNLPVEAAGKAKKNYKVTPLRDFLKELLMGRQSDEVTMETPAEILSREQAVNKAVNDLLRDDEPATEKMDVADPFRNALTTEKMDVDDIAESKMDDVAGPTEAIETEDAFDAMNLLMLATLAVTHEDLKPYEV